VKKFLDGAPGSRVTKVTIMPLSAREGLPFPYSSDANPAPLKAKGSLTVFLQHGIIHLPKFLWPLPSAINKHCETT
jgi:hypothetical protein